MISAINDCECSVKCSLGLQFVCLSFLFLLIAYICSNGIFVIMCLRICECGFAYIYIFIYIYAHVFVCMYIIHCMFVGDNKLQTTCQTCMQQMLLEMLFEILSKFKLLLWIFFIFFFVVLEVVVNAVVVVACIATHRKLNVTEVVFIIAYKKKGELKVKTEEKKWKKKVNNNILYGLTQTQQRPWDVFSFLFHKSQQICNMSMNTIMPLCIEYSGNTLLRVNII